jgi:hypothetical protein
MKIGRHGSTLPDAEQVRHALLPSGWRGKQLPKTTHAGQLSPQPSATFEILALKASRVFSPFCANTVSLIITTDPLEKSSLQTEAE